MTPTRFDAIICGEILISFKKAEKKMALSFWKPIKDDITFFHRLIVPFLTLHNALPEFV